MNILIIGEGGREHALAWKIKQSPRCTNLYVAPGNAGTSLLAENVPLNPNHFTSIECFCCDNNIDLLIIGPEVPLVNGLRDYLEKNASLKTMLIVGPDKQGARLEGSKEFSKEFMMCHHISTAKAVIFTSNQLEEALCYLDTISFPVVIKADGLAAGKGVIICPHHKAAVNAVHNMLDEKKFGKAGEKILIEQFLQGIELSVFILTDGNDYVLLPQAKDYKRVGKYDTGPNTGGMGAVSPVPFADEAFMDTVKKKIIEPTIKGMKKENISYRGFLFIGLMNVQGDPYVIEYNVRLGDPETQAILPRMEGDFVELLTATAQGNLTNLSIQHKKNYTVSVVITAEGYPYTYKKGTIIPDLTSSENAYIFHAGTKKINNTLVTNGGRVLTITGIGNTLDEASTNAYDLVSSIQWEESYFRKDIGEDLKT